MVIVSNWRVTNQFSHNVHKIHIGDQIIFRGDKPVQGNGKKG